MWFLLLNGICKAKPISNNIDPNKLHFKLANDYESNANRYLPISNAIHTLRKNSKQIIKPLRSEIVMLSFDITATHFIKSSYSFYALSPLDFNFAWLDLKVERFFQLHKVLIQFTFLANIQSIEFNQQTAIFYSFQFVAKHLEINMALALTLNWKWQLIYSYYFNPLLKVSKLWKSTSY